MLEATNPILAGMYPDPSICRVGAEFYLVNSTFEYFPGLPIHRSTDLARWELIGNAIDRAGQLDLSSVVPSGGLYAPTIRHDGGRFWIVCTLVGGGARTGNFLISATDPAGPWSDPVWIPGSRGMDPTIFFDHDHDGDAGDGDAWLAGCRLAEPGAYEGQTEIWLSRLDTGSGALLGPEHILWTGAVRGAVWSEGPHLYAIGGWYYLVTAEAGTERDHAVVVARSRRVTGPYEGCPRNPIFSHRTLGRAADVQNVGHADLVARADGSWWAVLLGVRTVDGRHLLGRETFLAPVSWEDGWPVLNPGHGRLTRTVPLGPDADDDDPAPGAGDRAPDGPTDGTPDGTPALAGARAGFEQEWLSLRGPATFAAHRDQTLVLAPGQATLRDAATPSFLGLRLADHHALLELTLDLPAAEVDALEAGLALYQSPGFHLTCAVERAAGGWRARAQEVRDGRVTELGAVALPAGAAAVTLRARLAGAAVEFSVAPGGGAGTVVASTSTAVLTTEVAGGFVGTVVGPYAVALRPSGAPEVRFTAFRYAPRRPEPPEGDRA